MKKSKKQIKEAFFDCLLEIALTFIFFGIGAFILSLFGLVLDSPNVDVDLTVLIGIVVPIVIFAIIFALVRWVRKSNNKTDPIHNHKN